MRSERCVGNSNPAYADAPDMLQTVQPIPARARSKVRQMGKVCSLCRFLTLDSMSGKSTYLRQIGLLTVQAMLGCL